MHSYCLLLLILTRIKYIAERIAPQIENNDGNKNRKAREEHEPWRGLQLQAAFIQHEAPFRIRRLAPESQEGKSGQFHHHGADICSGRNDKKRKDIWQNMMQKNMSMSAAADDGSFYEFTFF